eukprot:3570230-Pyramimonas_sp.AAC.1
MEALESPRGAPRPPRDTPDVWPVRATRCVSKGGGPVEDCTDPTRQNVTFDHASTCQWARLRIAGTGHV